MSRDEQHRGAVSEQVDAASGWTLRQAFERITNPALIESWRAAQSDYEKARTPIPSGSGSFLQNSPETIRKYRIIARQSFMRAKNEFRQVLADRDLYSTGSRKDAGASSQPPIFREGWKKLLIRNFDKSILQECGASKAQIYDVRIFPLVHSPEATARLSGRSFVEAFRMCVLNDPEVIAASKRIERSDRYKSVFEEGKFPGPLPNFRWPLDVTAADFAFGFVCPLGFFAGEALPEPSDALRHVSEVVVDRWRRLRRRLADRELGTEGTFAKTGIIQSVHALQWTRTNLSVDVQNGDLLEYDNHNPVKLWTGLMLQAATANERPAASISSPFHGKPPGYNRARLGTTARRATPVADQVAMAVKACGIADISDLEALGSWKQRAATVARFMDRPPTSENEWQAFIKALQRHFR